MFSSIVVSRYLKKIAELEGDIGEVGGSYRKLRVDNVSIYFKAPKPEQKPELGKPPAKKILEENFQWITYEIRFILDTDDGDNRYFIYQTAMEPSGTKKQPEKVFESDSKWSGKNKGNPSKEIGTDDVTKTFPQLLKKPELFPEITWKIRTNYINTDMMDPQTKKGGYSTAEFKENFDTDGYIVIGLGSIKENPFGRTVGNKVEAAMEEKELYKSAVNLAFARKKKREPVDPGAGFNIMKLVVRNPEPVNYPRLKPWACTWHS